LGDLPPSSTVEGIIFSAAHFKICEPTGVEPVNAILAMRLLVASASPASLPNPFTILSTPAGSKSPIISIKTKIEAGVCSAGFSTTQLPAARLFIQEDIYEQFIERILERTQQIKRGNPLDSETMVGAQASKAQFDKILSYIDIGKKEGAEVLTGGNVEQLNDDLNGGYYIQPTLLKGTNDMRVFQEEIFGPVISMSTFKDEAEALELANSSEFGLGAGVWSRNMNRAYTMGRKIEAGRVWTNCYHMYPAHAAFGGYKKSGIGRETHKLALEHYQQTKNLLVSYSEDPLGFF